MGTPVPPGQRYEVRELAKSVDPIQVLEAPAPVTTRLGALVSLSLIASLLILGGLALAFGAPVVGAPPNAPATYSAETSALYEKAASVYQAMARERSAFVKDVLLVVVPALTALAGYALGRSKGS